MTEKEKFLQRIQNLKDKGLRFIGLSPSRNPKDWVKSSSLEEEAYAELNRMHAAPDQPDPKVLGAHSP